MRRVLDLTLVLAALSWLMACGTGEPEAPASRAPDDAGHTAPTAKTAAANAAVLGRLPFGEEQDFEDARRGFIAGDPDVSIQRAGGGTVWDTRSYAFVEGDPPPSVHPNLWRQAKLNGIHGLFQVTDGIHQVRGYDISNMTLIEGRTGWILVDPLTSTETARAALALARKHLGDRPISAVILTHSHLDHFGGIAAVLPEDQDARGAIRVVAPTGFVRAATSENLVAGIAMSRRASFMVGMPLGRSSRGHVDSGLGKEPAWGEVGLALPTDFVDRTPQEMEIDGVPFVFQFAPDSEAPAELTFYLPEAKAFCGAEIVSHAMHNLYTLRGAQVRDARRWSGYIDEAIQLFGDAEVVFASHHWPTWDNPRVIDYLKKQRDTYAYIHDQTLRLANTGYTPREIAEELELPESLRTSFASRGSYGTLSHNAKAVYQRYFGWYDGNPANLEPLPPVEAGVRYVELMGGAEEILRKGRLTFERGEYRWLATVLNHLVFAEPDNSEARELLARTYDQLGYRAESGVWRDVYLTGAYELRHGVGDPDVRISSAKSLLRRVPLEGFFESMATRLVGPEAEDATTKLNLVFTDLDESYLLWIENAVLHHRRREPAPEADATIRLTHEFFLRLVMRQASLRDMIFSDEVDVDGSRLAVLSFFSLFEAPNEAFEIVAP